MTNSSKIKNVLATHILENATYNKQIMMDMLKKGFKGYDNMNLSEVTDMFVDMFGWAKYGEVVKEFSSNQKYIAYFDSSYVSQTKEGYISFVIKTEDNQLVYRNAQKVNIKNIYVGEAMALLRLLSKALELNISNIEIYGDNKNMIEKANSRKGGIKGWNGFFPSIASKMDKFDKISLTWNSREENKYADMLCRLVRRGANVQKSGGTFDFKELQKLSAKVG